MKTAFSWSVFGIFLLLVASCAGPAETPILVSLNTPTPSRTPLPPTATSTPQPTRTLRLTLPPTFTPTLAPTPLPGLPPPPGLIFQNDEGVWQVMPDGVPRVILGTYRTTRQGISSDGSRIIYGAAEELWLADLTTGERRQLTNTPERVEWGPVWWPARPDVIVLASYSEDEENCCWFTGSLTIVGPDGSRYQVLDERSGVTSQYAPSPGGQFIAYSLDGTPWLYRWGVGPEHFRPEDFLLSPPAELSFGHSAWSPDGRYLAWNVGFRSGEEYQLATGVFDFALRTAQLLHPYNPVGFYGFIPAPAWSPDGQWVSFFAPEASSPAAIADDAGLWVARPDGREERFLCESVEGVGCYSWSSGVWSPDARWLAFPSTSGRIWLAEAGTWQLYRVNLATGEELIAWLDVN